MTIGNLVCELRKEREISQKKLADAIGVSQATIAKIEVNRNEATAATIRKLATFFDVSADYLLGLEDDFGGRVSARTVTNAAPMGDSATTSEELRLLKVFRTLSPDLKNTLWSLLDTWTPTETLLPPKKKQT